MKDTEFNNAFKSKLHETFARTIQFLESHQLKWWVAYGTCIGAVRHHDLIPWDDDVDIFILKEDYDKLLTLSDELNRSSLLLQSPSQIGYGHSYSKIVDLNTTIWEHCSQPYLSGVWIDVFPLYTCPDMDYIQEKAENYSKRFSNYTMGLGGKWLHQFASALRHGHLLFALKQISKPYYVINNKHFHEEFLLFDKTISQKEGQYLVDFGGTRHYIYSKEWFVNHLSMPFNNYQVRVPQGYHEMLTMLYGNYMMIPPESERISHTMYYVNLNERLTMKEIKKRVKKGIYFE